MTQIAINKAGIRRVINKAVSIYPASLVSQQSACP